MVRDGYILTRRATSSLTTMARATRVEEDAHRVLQLIRALPQTRRKNEGTQGVAALRKRKEQAAPQRNANPKSLVQAKTQALMAVYGTRDTVPVAAKTKEEVGDEFERMSDEKRRELLEARRLIYRNHFSGLQATYSPTGRPKLETLIDAAVEAKRRSSKHSPLAIGAAVLSSHSRIFSSGRLEATAQDPRFDVCAERVALLKLLEHQSATGQIEVVEALVICSDQRGMLPVPCGSCREFLADFGDFPVFLLNAENDSHETRSFELFPHGRHTTYTAMALSSAADAKQPVMKKEETCASDRSMDSRDWSCEQVAQWLRDVVELPQYRDVFLEKRVDGATLWHLSDSDLQLLLGIVHPLHRLRLVTHIDRLRDFELLEHGVDFGQLGDYLAVLDRDRLGVVAQLKATFDRLDVNADGLLDFAELKHAMKTLGLTPSAQAVDQLVHQYRGEDHGITFPAFVQAFSQLAQLPAGEVRDAEGGGGVPRVDLRSLRETFDRADTNKSGSVDEKELVELLRSLGRDRCEERAKAWFEAADMDGDKRLSFAEFFLRYSQLTKLDMTPLQTLFEDGDGAVATRRRPTTALRSALMRLFPHEDPSDVSAWCSRRPWMDGSDGKGATSGSETLTYAEFALAVVMYAESLRLRVAQLKKMQETLGHNDPRCHRSRIVHLQQSGHVRLCHQSGGEAEDKTTSLGDKRKAQAKKTQEKKGEDEEQEDEEDEEGRRVERVFRRFADRRMHTETSNQQHHKSDTKGRDSDADEEEELRLNAVEAAQALLEVGIACSRDHLVRYLDKEGFGLRRAIGMREFERIYRRLRVFQEMPMKRSRGKAEEERVREMWAAIRRGEEHQEEKEQPKKNRERREYDAYLREKHAKSKDGKKMAEKERRRLAQELRGRERSRRDEMERARRRRKSRSDESSGCSDSDRGRRRRRARRSRSRRSSSSMSTTSTSSASSEAATRRGPRSRSMSRVRSEPLFRGFEVGDRVTAKSRGAGTIVRIYRDYFVADVHFDTGEKAKNVDLCLLKRVSEAESKAARAREKEKRDALVVGASVRVAHKGTKTSRRATIVRCRTNGTYDVMANECSERELLSGVSLAQIALERKPVVYSEGQRVTVKRKHEYLRGRVTLCRTNGTYDVRVRRSSKSGVLKGVAWGVLAPDEEESDEEDEEEEDETSRREAEKRQMDEEDGKQDEDEDEFKVGDRVEARFQGQQAYYAGRLSRVHRDGSCDVEYDDGDAESRVPRQLIRPAARSRSRLQDEYDDDFE